MTAVKAKLQKDHYSLFAFYPPTHPCFSSLFLLLWAGLRPNVMTFPTYAFDLIDEASLDYLLLRGHPYPSLKSLTSSPHRPEKFINPVAPALLLNV